MDKEERQAWGPLIREARVAAGLDQQTLAEMAGTSRRTIGSIERGDTVAQRGVLQRILAVLHLEGPTPLDPDVEGFLNVLGPLMQRLSPEERQRLIPAIVELVAEGLRGGSVVELRTVRRRPLSAEAPNLQAVANEGEIEGAGEFDD